MTSFLYSVLRHRKPSSSETSLTLKGRNCGRLCAILFYLPFSLILRRLGVALRIVTTRVYIVQTVDRPYYTVQYDQLTIRYNPDLGGALQRGERYRGPGARGSGGGLLVTLSRPGLSVIQSQRASTTAIDTVIASRNVASTENRCLSRPATNCGA